MFRECGVCGVELGHRNLALFYFAFISLSVRMLNSEKLGVWLVGM